MVKTCANEPWKRVEPEDQPEEVQKLVEERAVLEKQQAEAGDVSKLRIYP